MTATIAATISIGTPKNGPRSSISSIDRCWFCHRQHIHRPPTISTKAANAPSANHAIRRVAALITTPNRARTRPTNQPNSVNTA